MISCSFDNWRVRVEIPRRFFQSGTHHLKSTAAKAWEPKFRSEDPHKKLSFSSVAVNWVLWRKGAGRLLGLTGLQPRQKLWAPDWEKRPCPKGKGGDWSIKTEQWTTFSGVFMHLHTRVNIYHTHSQHKWTAIDTKITSYNFNGKKNKTLLPTLCFVFRVLWIRGWSFQGSSVPAYIAPLISTIILPPWLCLELM